MRNDLYARSPKSKQAGSFGGWLKVALYSLCLADGFLEGWRVNKTGLASLWKKAL